MEAVKHGRIVTHTVAGEWGGGGVVITEKWCENQKPPNMSEKSVDLFPVVQHEWLLLRCATDYSLSCLNVRIHPTTRFFSYTLPPLGACCRRERL